MQGLIGPLKELAEFEELCKNKKKDAGMIRVCGCVNSQKSHMMYAIGDGCKYKVIACSSETKAKQIYEEYRFLDNNTYLYPAKDFLFYKADIRDKEAMNEIFEKEEIESVIHFAGLKAVGESVVKPLEYYENNIAGTLVLCDVMRNHGVKNIIFSSSAGIYPDHRRVPEGNMYKSIRMDKMDAGADPDRSSYSRSGVECRTSSLLQSNRSS